MGVVKAKPFVVEIVLASAHPEDSGTLDGMLGGSAWKLIQTHTCEEALRAVRHVRVPIVLFDVNLGVQSWQESLRNLLLTRHEACVILLANEADRHLFDQIARHGGFELLVRPFEKRHVFQSLYFAYSQCAAVWPVGSFRPSRDVRLRSLTASADGVQSVTAKAATGRG